MLTIEPARRLVESEHDVVELLREYQAVELYYREAVAAMSIPERDVPPVMNSAQVTVSFRPTSIALGFGRAKGLVTPHERTIGAETSFAGSI